MLSICISCEISLIKIMCECLCKCVWNICIYIYNIYKYRRSAAAAAAAVLCSEGESRWCRRVRIKFVDMKEFLLYRYDRAHRRRLKGEKKNLSTRTSSRSGRLAYDYRKLTGSIFFSIFIVKRWRTSILPDVGTLWRRRRWK